MCRLWSCCCGCCSLRHGCIAVAITMLVLNGIGACLLALSLQSADVIRERVKQNPEQYFQHRVPTEREIEDLMSVSVTIARVTLAVFCVCLVFDLILLAGAYLRKRLLLIAWVVWYCISIVAMVAIGSYVLWATIASDTLDSPDQWAYVVGTYLSAVITVCFIVVVISYYLKLKDGEDGRGGYRPQSQTA